jgi:hypothetical protein
MGTPLERMTANTLCGSIREESRDLARACSLDPRILFLLFIDNPQQCV